MRREAAVPALDDASTIEPVCDIAVPQTVPLSEVCEVRVSNVDKKSEPGDSRFGSAITRTSTRTTTSPTIWSSCVRPRAAQKLPDLGFASVT